MNNMNKERRKSLNELKDRLETIINLESALVE